MVLWLLEIKDLSLTMTIANTEKMVCWKNFYYLQWQIVHLSQLFCNPSLYRENQVFTPQYICVARTHSFSSTNSHDMRVSLGKNPKKELPFLIRFKGWGHNDIATFGEGVPPKHAARVDVGHAGSLLVNGMQAIMKVLFNLRVYQKKMWLCTYKHAYTFS